MKILELRQILEGIESFEWDQALYFAKPSDYSLGAKCCVLDPDETEDLDGDTYTFAKNNNLFYCLSIADVQSVLDNAEQQLKNVSIGDFHKAFIYYLENDAFIEYV